MSFLDFYFILLAVQLHTDLERCNCPLFPTTVKPQQHSHGFIFPIIVIERNHSITILRGQSLLVSSASCLGGHASLSMLGQLSSTIPQCQERVPKFLIVSLKGHG